VGQNQVTPQCLEALESLSPEQQQGIKIAFAEGYLAAEHRKTPSRTMKWLKVTQQLLTIFLFLGVIISLMASLSGSMFRIQLGNQSEVDPEDIHVTFDDVKGVSIKGLFGALCPKHSVF